MSGSTALVTANGVVHVDDRHGSKWSQQSTMTNPDQRPGAWQDNFGLALALSPDTALIGAAPTPGTPPAPPGRAYIFHRHAHRWSLQTTLAGTTGGEDNFGSTVALSPTTALVGADLAGVGQHTSYGAAYLFTRHNARCVRSTIRRLPDSQIFGNAVALSAPTLLVSAARSNDGRGETFVYHISG